MIALKVAITAPDLSAWRDAVDPVELNEAVGQEFSSRLKSFFELKNRTPNAKGFPRTNFWRGIADATEYEEGSADATGATVKISDGRFALRYFGGVVTPKKGKYLAIPLTAEAAAAGSPREFLDLFPINGRGGNKFLARKIPSGVARLFLLTTSATHRPDASALPPVAETEKALAAHAEEFLRLKLEI